VSAAPESSQRGGACRAAQELWMSLARGESSSSPRWGVTQLSSSLVVNAPLGAVERRVKTPQNRASTPRGLPRFCRIPRPATYMPNQRDATGHRARRIRRGLRSWSRGSARAWTPCRPINQLISLPTNVHSLNHPLVSDCQPPNRSRSWFAGICGPSSTSLRCDCPVSPTLFGSCDRAHPHMRE